MPQNHTGPDSWVWKVPAGGDAADIVKAFTDFIDSGPTHTYPQPTTGDSGKILGVTAAGALTWQTPPTELPALTGHGGHVLEVLPDESAVRWVPVTDVTEMKAPVANAAALPATGNASGDIRITLDDGHMHVWVVDSTTPANSAWAQVGPAAAGTGLPTIATGDKGKALVVKADESGVEWGNFVPRDSSNLPRFNAGTAYQMGTVILGSDGNAWAAMKNINAGGQEPGLPRWVNGWMLASGEDIIYYLTRNMARDDIDDATLRGLLNVSGVSPSLISGPFDPNAASYADRSIVTHMGVTYVCIGAWQNGDPAPSRTDRGGSNHWLPLGEVETTLFMLGLIQSTSVTKWANGSYADRTYVFHNAALWRNTSGAALDRKEPGVDPGWTRTTIEDFLAGGSLPVWEWDGFKDTSGSVDPGKIVMFDSGNGTPGKLDVIISHYSSAGGAGTGKVEELPFLSEGDTIEMWSAGGGKILTLRVPVDGNGGPFYNGAGDLIIYDADFFPNDRNHNFSAASLKSQLQALAVGTEMMVHVSKAGPYPLPAIAPESAPYVKDSPDEGKVLTVDDRGRLIFAPVGPYLERDLGETLLPYDNAKAYSAGDMILEAGTLWYAPIGIAAGSGAPKNGRYRSWLPVTGYDLAKLYPLLPSIDWWRALLEDPTAGQLGVPTLFDAARTYSPGHMVISGNKLWHANVSSTGVTPSPTTPEWTYVSLVDVVQRLANAGGGDFMSLYDTSTGTLYGNLKAPAWNAATEYFGGELVKASDGELYVALRYHRGGAEPTAASHQSWFHINGTTVGASVALLNSMLGEARYTYNGGGPAGGWQQAQAYTPGDVVMMEDVPVVATQAIPANDGNGRPDKDDTGRGPTSNGGWAVVDIPEVAAQWKSFTQHRMKMGWQPTATYRTGDYTIFRNTIVKRIASTTSTAGEKPLDDSGRDLVANPGWMMVTLDEVARALHAVPAPAAADAGKAVTVNAAGTGYELAASAGGGNFVSQAGGDTILPSDGNVAGLQIHAAKNGVSGATTDQTEPLLKASSADAATSVEVDKDGRLVATSPHSSLHVNDDSIEWNSDLGTWVGLESSQNAAPNGASVVMRRARGNRAAQADVQANDQIGAVTWMGRVAGRNRGIGSIRSIMTSLTKGKLSFWVSQEDPPGTTSSGMEEVLALHHDGTITRRHGEVVPHITKHTAAPTASDAGSDGDVWLVYVP